MTRFARSAAALSIGTLVALSACAEPDDDATDLQSDDTISEARAMAQSLDTGEFMELELGAKIVGPRGPEVKTSMSNAQGNFADLTSYVACPAGMDPCDPKSAPEGTIYTYVHIVYPGEDNDPTTGSGDGIDSSDIEVANEFRMTSPAHGFTGVVGYGKRETLAAIGEKAEAFVTCVDGALAWRIEAGDGGDQWEQSEPITFYWQSTLPPFGPAKVYEIEANYTRAQGEGPYPAASENATNACDLPEPSTTG